MADTPPPAARPLAADRAEILALINDDVPLAEVLTEICLRMEARAPDTLASILLTDEDHTHLVDGAAPHLPSEYREAVDGLSIAEGVGSCGHAVYTGEPTAVEDIDTHPNWIAYRALAVERHGLRSCWATPITSHSGEVIGSFALYRRSPGAPEGVHRRLAEAATHLVAIAVERERERDRLRRLGR